MHRRGVGGAGGGGGGRRLTAYAATKPGGATTRTPTRTIDPALPYIMNAKQQSQSMVYRRTYMDVHQRPSHSGMFQRNGGGGGIDKIPPPVTTSAVKVTPVPPGEDAQSAFSLYNLLLSRAAMAAGIIYVVTEYICDITLCEGPSMSPTLKSSGEIVLIDKWTVRRYGVADGCRGIERIRAALQRQEAFVQQQQKRGAVDAGVEGVVADGDDDDYVYDDEDVWHARRISVSDLDPPTWNDLWTMLSTPLSIGDVVVVHHPSRKGTVCKRVVGLPGDTVLKPLSGLLVVPDGHVWLEGDNPVK